VLVVGCEDAGVDYGSPGDFEVFVDGLRAEDAGGADFVGPFAGLVEHEGEDILVVGDGDARLLLVVCEGHQYTAYLHALEYQLP
jgi:hypothetical protein